MEASSFSALVQAWLARADQPAAAELFRRMQPLARRVVADYPALRTEADDLAQQIVIRAFAALPRFDLGRRLEPWLRVLAQRCCFDRLRVLQRRGPEAEAAAAGREEPDPAPGPDARLMAAEFQRDLSNSLARLPPGDRRVLELVQSGECSLREVAERLGCAPGALKVRTHRARTRLRGLLAQSQALPLAA